MVGYGLIIPDLLGYGGTSKPLNPADYSPSLIAKDLIDLLEVQHIDKAIAIGHDLFVCLPQKFVQVQLTI